MRHNPVCVRAGAAARGDRHPWAVTNISADGFFVMVMTRSRRGTGAGTGRTVRQGGADALGTVGHRVEGQGFAIKFLTLSQDGARARLEALLRDFGALSPCTNLPGADQHELFRHAIPYGSSTPPASARRGSPPPPPARPAPQDFFDYFC